MMREALKLVAGAAILGLAGCAAYPPYGGAYAYNGGYAPAGGYYGGGYYGDGYAAPAYGYAPPVYAPAYGGVGIGIFGGGWGGWHGNDWHGNDWHGNDWHGRTTGTAATGTAADGMAARPHSKPHVRRRCRTLPPCRISRLRPAPLRRSAAAWTGTCRRVAKGRAEGTTAPRSGGVSASGGRG